jgi:hypothetical protein
VTDPGLWGHLRFGLDTLKSGIVAAQVDPCSYLSAGQCWINHKWLAEVLFASAYRIVAVSDLILLKMVIGFMLLGIIYL